MQRSPVLFRRKRRILRIRGLLLAVARGNCCSHGFNRAGLWLCWCCSLPRPLTGQKSPHRAKFVFLPRTSLPLPLKGEGRDFAHLWGFGFSLAVAFGNRWPQPAHTAPTGRVCCFPGVVSLPGPQNRTQGHTGASLVFTVFSWCVSFAVVPLTGAPGGS